MSRLDQLKALNPEFANALAGAERSGFETGGCS